MMFTMLGKQAPLPSNLKEEPLRCHKKPCKACQIIDTHLSSAFEAPLPLH